MQKVTLNFNNHLTNLLRWLLLKKKKTVSVGKDAEKLESLKMEK